MKVIEVIAQVRDNLQDANANYWSDSELLNLHNECKRHLAAERQEKPTSKSITLLSDTNTYTVDGVLRYISVKDSDNNVFTLYPDDGSGDDDLEGIIVQDYNSIYVNNPVADLILTFKVISFPLEDNLGTIVRSGDENAYKYYMLSKAYEKESDMENFQKSSYFRSMFSDAIGFIKKNARLDYVNKTQITKGYYY
jgi:hypothetical protein